MRFIQLWNIMIDVQPLPQLDMITWKWMPLGSYTVDSAYKCQFLVVHAPFDMKKIWRVHAEPRRRFFAWLGAHRKIRTVDNLYGMAA